MNVTIYENLRDPSLKYTKIDGISIEQQILKGNIAKTVRVIEKQQATMFAIYDPKKQRSDFKAAVERMLPNMQNSADLERAKLYRGMLQIRDEVKRLQEMNMCDHVLTDSIHRDKAKTVHLLPLQDDYNALYYISDNLENLYD
ncbi:hypothetical protein I4U23_020041 [Adineta vaga]|nr:hypothetical protein I4U23_020041 [Adineta vaga]